MLSPRNAQFTKREVKKAFDSFDLDHNGFIGVGELRTIYTAIGEEVTDAELDEMIKMVDIDGDGQCDFSEFQKMIFRYADRAMDEDEISSGDEDERQPSRSSDRKHDDSKKGGGRKVRETRAMETKERAAKLRGIIAKLKISNDTINKCFNKFSESKQAHIDYKHFCDLLERPKSKDMANLFGLFGGKGSRGKIDVREFLVALSSFCATSKKDQISFVFKLFDEDQSGFISRPELVRILKTNYMAKSSAEVQRKADLIMRQADKDGDQQISMEEFDDVCARFPNLIFPRHNAFKT